MTIKEQAEQLRQAFKEQYGVDAKITIQVFNNLKKNFSPEDAYENAEKVSAELGIGMSEKHEPSPENMEQIPGHRTLRWYTIAASDIQYTVFFNEPPDMEKAAG